MTNGIGGVHQEEKATATTKERPQSEDRKEATSEKASS